MAPKDAPAENIGELQDGLSRKGNNEIFSNQLLSNLFLGYIVMKKDLEWDLVSFSQKSCFKFAYFEP